jgi:hypothetical protein
MKGALLTHLWIIIAFLFWALEHTNFEGFENTNPRGQLGGERSHLTCSKLGLGDAILHPHHSTIATGTINHQGQQQDVTLGVFSKGGAPLREGRFDPGV